MRKYSRIFKRIHVGYNKIFFHSLNNSEDSDDDETSFAEDRKKKDLALVRHLRKT